VLTTTEAIVLRNQRYGEADLIVTYLTRDRGIIKAFAKSPRKIKSRFGSSLEPLTYSRISLLGREHSVPRITRSDIINPFCRLRENYDDLMNISRIIKIMLSVVPEDTPNKTLFNFFLSVLNLIDSSAGRQRHTLYLIALVRLLAMTGYAPRLNKCGRCGSGGIDFYPGAGTILCNRCARDQETEEPPLKVNGDVINFYSHSIEWPVQKLTRLRPRREILSTLSSIMERHILQNLGLRL